jgi:hypothetical protein
MHVELGLCRSAQLTTKLHHLSITSRYSQYLPNRPYNVLEYWSSHQLPNEFESSIAKVSIWVLGGSSVLKLLRARADSQCLKVLAGSMEVWGIGSIISLILLSSTIVSAITSTQYDIERTSRLVKNLSGSFRALERKLDIYRGAVEPLAKSAKHSSHYLSLRSDLEAACRQFNGLILRIDAICIGQTNHGDTCARLIKRCQLDDIRIEPAFWKLQKWTMVSI